MTVTYKNDPRISSELKVQTTAPDEPAERQRIVSDLVAMGAKFPGNAAGFEIIEILPYEPTPEGVRSTSGSNLIDGTFRVRSRGLRAYRADETPTPEHLTTLYVYASETERTESIRIRLSAVEKDRLQSLAADAGESVSAYVRRTCGL